MHAFLLSFISTATFVNNVETIKQEIIATWTARTKKSDDIVLHFQVKEQWHEDSIILPVEFSAMLSEQRSSNRGRLIRWGQFYDTESKKIVDRSVLQQYRGETVKSYHKGGTEFPVLAITPKMPGKLQRVMILNAHFLVPFLVAEMPLREGIAGVYKMDKPSTLEQLPDGNISLKQGFIRYVVEGKQPFRLLETSTTKSDGSPLRTAKLRYRKTMTGESQIAGWDSVSYGDRGKVLIECHTDVTELKYNQATDDDFKEPDIEAGTWITESKGPQDIKQSIYRGPDDIREVLPGEYNGKNYQQLLATDPPRQTRSYVRWILLSAGLVLIFVIAKMIRKRLNINAVS